MSDRRYDLKTVRRILDRVIENENGCWIWQGTTTTGGYPQIGYEDKIVYVHRLMHEFFVGPIPEGWQVDHVKARGCTSPSCVRPTHLEAVTPQENLRRSSSFSGERMRQETCSKGHALEAVQVRHGKVRRGCRTCKNDKNRERMRNLRGYQGGSRL